MFFSRYQEENEDSLYISFMFRRNWFSLIRSTNWGWKSRIFNVALWIRQTFENLCIYWVLLQECVCLYFTRKPLNRFWWIVPRNKARESAWNVDWTSKISSRWKMGMKTKWEKTFVEISKTDDIRERLFVNWINPGKKVSQNLFFGPENSAWIRRISYRKKFWLKLSFIRNVSVFSNNSSRNSSSGDKI